MFSSSLSPAFGLLPHTMSRNRVTLDGGCRTMRAIAAGHRETTRVKRRGDASGRRRASTRIDDERIRPASMAVVSSSNEWRNWCGQTSVGGASHVRWEFYLIGPLSRSARPTREILTCRISLAAELCCAAIGHVNSAVVIRSGRMYWCKTRTTHEDTAARRHDRQRCAAFSYNARCLLVLLVFLDCQTSNCSRPKHAVGWNASLAFTKLIDFLRALFWRLFAFFSNFKRSILI